METAEDSKPAADTENPTADSTAATTGAATAGDNDAKTPVKKEAAAKAASTPTNMSGFYAIRPNSIIDEPVMFFGFKQFDSFVKFKKQELGFKDLSALNYKVFDKMADAMAFINMEDGGDDDKEQDKEPAAATATTPAPAGDDEAEAKEEKPAAAKADGEGDAMDVDDSKPAAKEDAAAMNVDGEEDRPKAEGEDPTTPGQRRSPRRNSTAKSEDKEKILRLRRELKELLAKAQDSGDEDEEEEDSDDEDTKPAARKRRASRTPAKKKATPAKKRRASTSAKKSTPAKKRKTATPASRKRRAVNQESSTDTEESGYSSEEPTTTTRKRPARKTTARKKAAKKKTPTKKKRKSTPTRRSPRSPSSPPRPAKKRTVVYTPETPEQWEENFKLLEEYRAEFGNCNVASLRVNPDLPEKYKSLNKWVNRQRAEISILHQRQAEKQDAADATAEGAGGGDEEGEKKDAAATQGEDEKKGIVEGGEEGEKKEATAEGSEETEKKEAAAGGDEEAEKKEATAEGNEEAEKKEAAADGDEVKKEGSGDGEDDSSSNVQRITMNDERKQRLVDLGFDLDVEVLKFEEKFELLQKYKDEHGDCDVPNYRPNMDIEPQYKSLPLWVKKQRDEIIAFEKLEPAEQDKAVNAQMKERRERLLELGFQTVPEDSKWEARFELLKQYKEENGHCNVPSSRSADSVAEKYKVLPWFVKNQRDVIAKFDEDPESQGSKMSLEKRQKLVDLGFVIDPESVRWDEMFELLKKYKDDFGDCIVPQGNKIPEVYRPLYLWLRKQRTAITQFEEDPYQKTLTKMTQERRSRLLDLGVVVDLDSYRWDEKYELLKEYKAEFGDCEVDYGVPEKYKALTTWVRKQREDIVLYEQDPASKTNGNKIMGRKQKLLDIGFIVDPFTDKWEDMYELLVKYKLEHGNCNVPYHDASGAVKEEYRPLKKWLFIQKRLLSAFEKDGTEGALTSDKRVKLLNLGLTPQADRVSREERWEEKFDLLRQYKEEFGDCFVQQGQGKRLPGMYKPLVQWVSKNRELLRNYDESDSSKNGNMTPERKQRLLDLGFVVDIRTVHWETKFELLRQYKEEHGDCNVPCSANSRELQGKYKPLASWVQLQRRELRAFESGALMTTDRRPHRMTAERRQRLLGIGFSYTDVPSGPSKETQKVRFEAMFKRRLDELKQFKAEHGHVDVTKGTNLNAWLWMQRRNYTALQEGKESFLRLEHIVALTGLGFSMTSNVVRKRMKDRIPEYVDFVKRHGRFPDERAKDDEECRLGQAAQRWRLRRKLFGEGTKKTKKLGNCDIPQQLIEDLDSVGFRWDTREGNFRVKKPTPIPWETRYEMLKVYKEKHGHCEPPKRHPKLGSFVCAQRKQYKYMTEGKRSNLSVERFRKLSEIGFRFKPSQAGRSRQRYVDDDSSGYDTSSDEEGKAAGTADNNATPAAAAAAPPTVNDTNPMVNNNPMGNNNLMGNNPMMNNNPMANMGNNPMGNNPMAALANNNLLAAARLDLATQMNNNMQQNMNNNNMVMNNNNNNQQQQQQQQQQQNNNEMPQLANAMAGRWGHGKSPRFSHLF